MPPNREAPGQAEVPPPPGSGACGRSAQPAARRRVPLEAEHAVEARSPGNPRMPRTPRDADGRRGHRGTRIVTSVTVDCYNCKFEQSGSVAVVTVVTFTDISFANFM